MWNPMFDWVEAAECIKQQRSKTRLLWQILSLDSSQILVQDDSAPVTKLIQKPQALSSRPECCFAVWGEGEKERETKGEQERGGMNKQMSPCQIIHSTHWTPTSPNLCSFKILPKQMWDRYCLRWILAALNHCFLNWPNVNPKDSHQARLYCWHCVLPHCCTISWPLCTIQPSAVETLQTLQVVCVWACVYACVHVCVWQCSYGANYSFKNSRKYHKFIRAAHLCAALNVPLTS